jgi:F-type H+-transporting ATPase subunit b
MRIRLFAAGVLAAGLVFGTASIALAQTAEPTSATATTLSPEQAELNECLETQLAAQTPDLIRCAQAPNPILPATNEIIAGTLAFFILLGVLWKFALPGLKQGMEGRTERIRDDLQKAEDARLEAEGALEEYRQRLATAKQEATRIIEDARATADSLKHDLAQRAEGEIAEMKQRAAADIEASKTQAIADLHGEVAELAIGAAEVVVQKNLDHDTQIQLIENYINQVGSQA